MDGSHSGTGLKPPACVHRARSVKERGAAFLRDGGDCFKAVCLMHLEIKPNKLYLSSTSLPKKERDLKKADNRGHDDQTFNRCTEQAFVIKCPNLYYLFESLCVFVKSSFNR